MENSLTSIHRFHSGDVLGVAPLCSIPYYAGIRCIYGWGTLPGGTISASPNPCDTGSGTTCTTTISWATQGVTSAYVTVQDTSTSADESLFAQGTAGSQSASFIGLPPHQYIFRLKGSSGQQWFLNSVVVTGHDPPVYSINWGSTNTPGSMAAGATVTTNVSMINTGTLTALHS